MECTDALILISGHIDNQNTPQEEAALQAHLLECPECRRVLEAYERINSGVADLSEPAPEGLADAVMSRIRAEKTKKTRRPWRSVGAAAGLVAAVLVLLIGTKTIKLPKMSDNMQTPVKDTAVVAVRTDAPGEAAPDEEPLPATLACAETNAAYAPEMTQDAEVTDAPMYADTEAQTEPAPNGGRHFRHPLGFAPLLLLDNCQTLSKENSCAVLLCEGFGLEFFDWLKDVAPELAAQFIVPEDAETDEEIGALPEITVSTDEELGTVTVKTTYTAVAALQEWFCRVLSPQADEDTVLQVQDELTALGLDGSSLAKIYTFPEDFSIEQWPENWQEDFAEKWLKGENRQLFYPDEDYLPADDDAAYLVLLPPLIEEEP